jgi:hypothetical protein
MTVNWDAIKAKLAEDETLKGEVAQIDAHLKSFNFCEGFVRLVKKDVPIDSNEDTYKFLEEYKSLKADKQGYDKKLAELEEKYNESGKVDPEDSRYKKLVEEIAELKDANKNLKQSWDDDKLNAEKAKKEAALQKFVDDGIRGKVTSEKVMANSIINSGIIKIDDTGEITYTDKDGGLHYEKDSKKIFDLILDLDDYKSSKISAINNSSPYKKQISGQVNHSQQKTGYKLNFKPRS